MVCCAVDLAPLWLLQFVWQGPPVSLLLSLITCDSVCICVCAALRSTPVGESLLKFNFRGNSGPELKETEAKWNGSFRPATHNARLLKVTPAQPRTATTSTGSTDGTLALPTAPHPAGTPVRTRGRANPSVFRKQGAVAVAAARRAAATSTTANTSSGDSVDRLRRELPKFQSMAVTLAETAKTQEMRVRMQAAVRERGKRESLSPESIGKAAVASPFTNKGSVVLDPTTGLPAHFSEEESMRAQLIVGGRYDMAELQREAVEEARKLEARRLEREAKRKQAVAERLKWREQVETPRGGPSSPQPLQLSSFLSPIKPMASFNDSRVGAGSVSFGQSPPVPAKLTGSVSVSGSGAAPPAESAEDLFAPHLLVSTHNPRKSVKQLLTVKQDRAVAASSLEELGKVCFSPHHNTCGDVVEWR